MLATTTRPRRSEGVEIDTCPICSGNGCSACDFTGSEREPEENPWILFAEEEDDEVAA